MEKLISALFLLVFLLGGCAPTAKRDKGVVSITASIEPQRYFIGLVGGDKVRVTTLVPKGVVPETYDVTPKQMVDLSESDAFFLMGFLPFEWELAGKFLDQNPHATVINMSDGVKTISSDTLCGHGVKVRDHGFVEPHTWMSVPNAAKICVNTAEALAEIDPDNASFYRANADSASKRFVRLENSIEQRFAGKTCSFLIYHPALTYFAADYGLTQISVEREGKEPSPRELQTVIREAAGRGVKLMFVQPEFDMRSAEAVAKETGTEIVTFNPLDADWERQINCVVDAMAAQMKTE